jgi:Pyruvate/2-oxoacid:ferredoxin oxidoreductase delta subunit
MQVLGRILKIKMRTHIGTASINKKVTMNYNNAAYRNLAKKYSLEAMIGPDEGESLLLELLVHCFTIEEAELAAHLPFFYKTHTLEKVARTAGKEPADIKPLLDAMVSRGVIRGRGKGYALLPILPGMFENVLMDNLDTPWHREFARIANRLYETGYVRKYLEHPTRVVRTVPLNLEQGPAGTAVDPDRVEQMIRSHDLMAVLNNCQCRHARHLEGQECKRADRLDGCFAFGNIATLYIDRGGARAVDRDSMRSIVKDRISKNLTFFAGNVAAGSANQICTCCECCCHMLGQIIGVDPGLIVTTPKFRAVVNEDRCTDCGRCLAPCNLRAHTMEGKRHRYDPSRCVGCGLCVRACPAAAIDMFETDGYRKPAADLKRLAVRLAPAKIMAVIKGKLVRK